MTCFTDQRSPCRPEACARDHNRTKHRGTRKGAGTVRQKPNFTFIRQTRALADAGQHPDERDLARCILCLLLERTVLCAVVQRHDGVRGGVRSAGANASTTVRRYGSLCFS